ncbi:PBECR2 nuclease fold domain-containing protein [Massilia sp. BJB1822]|uniref:PBECR2 nuclease fold domain-containing protein n=1 Tax=Massilia sp. BJB1822 TaxID=2744470 RepID=UPI00159481BC|nr:PBECR2 nuclease fold domain-containing protein [Massilia sp. BJB1822]NVD96596.1 hypothetical protein [Massilia sp. BJB1822]
MQEKKKQKTSWKEIGHPDLRDLPPSRRLPDQEVIRAGESADAALTILEHHLGFVEESLVQIEIETPVGVAIIERSNLRHIVEKRQEARERYVKYAMATMLDPFEVWLVEYADEGGNEELRNVYIGAFQGKKQMLVVFIDANGRVLWNFMHGDSKALNKHRHGECIYSRL